MKIIYEECDMCDGYILLVCGRRKNKVIVQCDRCGSMFEIYDNRMIHDVRKALVKNKKKLIGR